MSELPQNPAQNVCGTDEWIRNQGNALQNAYGTPEWLEWQGRVNSPLALQGVSLPARQVLEGSSLGSASPKYPSSDSVDLEGFSPGQRESRHGQREQLNAVGSAIHLSTVSRKTLVEVSLGRLRRWFEQVLRGFRGR